MKKLMFAAAAAVMTSGAFAAPLVYDYKASAKHLYLKEVKVNAKKALSGFSGIVYQKYQKSSSLKGYLIMDQSGFTSPTINIDVRGGDAAPYSFKYNGFDYGRNRGFLVVLNNSVSEKAVKHAKILPAVLDAKWIDTAFTKEHMATSGLAEGTLFVGGDAIAPVREQLDVVDGIIVGRGAAPALPVAAGESSVAAPGMVAAADYVWTSIYLFGQFNGPNWFNRYEPVNNCPFGQFEYAWDQALPEGLQTGWYQCTDGEGTIEGKYRKWVINYYHDTWLNGAGFGKWTTKKIDIDEYCCGIVEYEKGVEGRTLECLSGNLKGGLFLCTENGIDAKRKDATYSWFDGEAWEDQFNTARPAAGYLFFADEWQNDLWQDGFIEQETTDVISGTWSIKLNTKFFAEKNGIAQAVPEKYLALIQTLGGESGKDAYIVDPALWAAIYGAAVKLDKNVNFYDGSEIYNKSIGGRFTVPMLTPQFIDYYRLRYFENKVN